MGCGFVSGFFHHYVDEIHPYCLHIVVICLFLLLYSIAFYENITLYLPILLLMDIRMVFSLGLL